jgi:outer membrane receptor for ferrienterochelin and colicins
MLRQDNGRKLTPARTDASRIGLAAAVLQLVLLFPLGALAEEKPDKKADQYSTKELMEMDLKELLAIVVSPTKERQKISEAPAVIAVITAEEIEVKGYRTVAEALRNLPGIYVRDDLLHPNVGMRGVDAGLRSWNRDIKVMINGQPVAFRSNNSNWLGHELVPMSAISRIEVIRGPASAIYGADAFLGVINIITREPTKDGWAKVNATAGGMARPCPMGNSDADFDGTSVDTCERYGSKMSPTVTVDGTVAHVFAPTEETKLSFTMAAALTHEDRSGLLLPSTSPHFYETGPKYARGEDPDLESKHDTNFPLVLFGQVGLEHKRHGKLTFEGHFQQFERRGEFTDWGVLTHENVVGLRNGYGRLKYENVLRSVGYTINLALSGGEETAANHLQVLKDNTFWVQKDVGYLGFDGGLDLRYPVLPSLTIIGGTGVTVDDHKLPSIYSVSKHEDPPRVVPAYLQDDKIFVNAGVFLHLIYNPVEKLSCIAGARFDWHNVYGNECTFSSCPGFNSRLGVVYRLYKQAENTLHVKLLYGSSFKAPSPELIYGTPYVTSGISGNLDLQPQKAYTWELAVDGTFKGKLEVNADGFLSVIQEKVEYSQFENFVRAENSSDIITYGFEGMLRYRPVPQASLYANVSLQNSVVTECLLKEDEQCDQLSEYMYLFPHVITNFGGDYTFKKIRTTLSLYGTYVGDRWASPSNRQENVPKLDQGGYDYKAYQVPGYVLLNLSVLTRLKLMFDKDTMFRLNIMNALHQGIVEPGFNGIDIPGPGFTLLFSVQQNM